MKILLVDDVDVNLTLLEILLGSRGHATVRTSNGQEALEAARRNPPELVISDILMPVLDGYSLCKAWMQDPALRAIPFVFYTATYQSDEDETFALGLGATAFLRKPMEPEPFLKQIEQVIRNAGGPRPQPPQPPPVDDLTFLKLYSERLVNKLDQRSQKLASQVEELQRTQASLRLKGFALEATANGILILDRNGLIEWVNPAFLAMTGYADAEVRGRDPRFLRSSFHDPEFFQHLWTTIQAGHTWHGEMVIRHKAGSLVTCQTAITPMRDEGGALSHFIAILQDITEQRRVEAELRQSQKLEAIGRLAGGVAHDFNNMLNVILINAELALDSGNLPEPLRQRLAEIQEAALRSADLTRQLLAFSRKQPAQPRRINLNRLLEEHQKMLQRMIEGDIELSYRLAPELHPVFMDPSQVGQILANLVINARDALPGAGTICIETSNVSLERRAAQLVRGLSPGNYVQLTVSDTGCGMDAHTLEHLFEPFFTTKSEGKGTGLGLSTVYGIVTQNGGAITAYSNPGLGTSMKIYLPDCGGEAPETGPGPDTFVPGGTETILVVEDEKPIVDILTLVLEDKGYHVLSAQNGLDGYLLAKDHPGPVDLLITDVVMPGLNGKELEERIQGLRPGLKVLFISGYTGDILAKRGLLQEETQFLQKPFRGQDLARKVREVLDR